MIKNFLTALMITLLATMIISSCQTTANAFKLNLLKSINLPNHFALIRHAHAPGTGDPLNFTLGDCTTQRNLDYFGRIQAKQIGELLKRNGVSFGDIFSSEWCRCKETAQLLNIGNVKTLPALNSFYQLPENKLKQIASLRNFIANQQLTKPIIFVTHFVNIGALTGIYPKSGNIVVVRREKNGMLSVLGEIDTSE